MKNYFILFLMAACSLLFGSCISYPTTKDAPLRRITTYSGPEDMGLINLNGTTSILVSCAERREKIASSEFWIINPISEKAKPLSVKQLPSDVHLDLHGIEIRTLRDTQFVFAIDHDPLKNKHHIQVFYLLDSALVYYNTIRNDDYLINPNDLCSDVEGNLYVSNFLGKGSPVWQYLFNIPKSSIVKFDATSHTWSVLADKLRYANGVIVFREKLYISTTRMKGIYVLDKNKTLQRVNDSNRIVNIKGLDNIMSDGDSLYTTAHPSFGKFFRHAIHPKNDSPSQVFSIDPEKKTYRLLYQSNGKEISGASTALPIAGKLFISQVFQPYVGSVDRITK